MLWAVLALVLSTVPAQADRDLDGRGCKREGKHCRWDSQCCTGLVCGEESACVPGCRIDGALYPAGALNPDTPCLACRPSVSTRQWSSVADGIACDDGDVCTTDDSCAGGACSGGLPPDCSDLDICTRDSCDPLTGCGHAPVAPGEACDMWVTDGSVASVSRQGDTLYVAGDFQWVSPLATGGGIPLDSVTGLPPQEFPKILGRVAAVAPDGQGGWFVGGNFTHVGGRPRYNLAHVLADGTVADWNPCGDQATGASNCTLPVLSLAAAGGYVYVGGHFPGTVGGKMRQGLAIIDALTGETTDRDPVGPSQFWRVFALLATEDTVYAAGEFFNGASVHLAAIDATTGAVTWGPPTEAPVSSEPVLFALAVRGDTLYVGGHFAAMGGLPRRGLAAIDIPTWQVTPWDPDVNFAGGNVFAGVRSMVVDGTTVFLAGRFDTVGGKSRNGLASVDAATGVVSGWDPAPGAPENFSISSLALGGETVYVGGSILYIGAGEATVVAAIDARTGARTPWDPRLHLGTNLGGALVIAVEGRTVFAGGDFVSLGGVPRAGLAAFDLRTGRPTDWNPNPDCFGDERRFSFAEVAATEDKLFVAGSFVRDGGLIETIDALKPRTGAVGCRDWTFEHSGQIKALAPAGDVLYVGGYDFYFGDSRNGAYSLDAATGQLTSWDPDFTQGYLTGSVSDLLALGDTLYVAGSFFNVSGAHRTALAAFDMTTGLLTPWDPNPSLEGGNPWVASLAGTGDTVYIAGDFQRVTGAERPGLAATSPSSGFATPWNPGVGAHSLGLDGDTLYAGGPGLFAFDAFTAERRAWDPDPHPRPSVFQPVFPRVLAAGGGLVFVGGEFGLGGGQVFSGIAALAGVPRPPGGRVRVSPDRADLETVLPGGR